MSDPASIKRQLTIKSNVVKRLTKEEATYDQEAKQQEERLQQAKDKVAAQAKAAGGDQEDDGMWQVRNQVRAKRRSHRSSDWSPCQPLTDNDLTLFRLLLP